MQLPEFVERIRSAMAERGIPPAAFPAVAVLLIVIIAAGVLFLGAPSSKAFRFKVMSGADAIDGAVVEVYDEAGNFVASATSKNGIASFDSLPAKKLVFKVSKDKVNATKTIDLGLSTGSSINLAAYAAQVAAGTTPRVVPLVPPAAVQGPPLNSKGLAQLEFAGQTNGKALALVKDELNRVVEGAEVRIFDASDGGASSPLATVTTIRSGVASFKDLPVGAKVYAVVSVSGYLTYDGSAESAEVPDPRKGMARFVVKLSKATDENSASSTVAVINEENATVPARIVISSSLNKPLFDNETAGAWSGPLERASAYYASVYAKGYLPAWSELAAGDQKTFILSKATPEVSANLTVRVKDEKGRPMADATVSVFFENGPMIPVTDPKLKTNSNGTARISGLALQSVVRVAVSKGVRFNDETIVALVDAENDVEVSLVLYPAVLRLSAFDALTNATVPADFVVFSGNQTINTCSSGAGECVAQVFANIPLKISASASGYLPLPEFEVTLSTDEERAVSLPLVSSASLQNTLVYFIGLFNDRGEKVTNVELGGAVQARFQLASAGGDMAGLYVRVGDSAEAGISGHSPKVGFYGGSGFDCGGNELEDYGSTTYKWIDVFYQAATPVSTVFTVDVKVSPTSDKTSLDIYYRSYLVKGGQWLRNPYDQDLGTAESSARKQKCAANAQKVSFPIGAKDTVCSDRACVSTTYEQDQKGKTAASGFGFSAMTVGDCFTGDAFNAACDRGLVRADFKVQDFFRNPKKIRVATAGQVVPIVALEVDTYDGYGGKARKTFTFTGSAGVAEIDVASIRNAIAYRGIIEGTAYLAPKAASSGTPVSVEFDNGGAAPTRYESKVLVRTPDQPFASPEREERLLLEKVDDCFTREIAGQPVGSGITIDAHPDLGLSVPCTKFAFIVDPIFPADAIPFEIRNPEITFKLEAKDGSDKCFEFDKANGVLKYYTEKPECPEKFKVHGTKGNVIIGANATLLFQYRGDFAQIGVTVLNVTMGQSDLSPSAGTGVTLAISDAVRNAQSTASLKAIQVGLGLPSQYDTGDVGGALSAVRLIAVFNNKQIGSMRADLVDTSESASGFAIVRDSAFNGPGYKLFAVVDRGEARQLTLWKGLTRVTSLADAVNTGVETTISNLRSKAESVANATAFRRSHDTTFFCETDENGEPTERCKPSLEGWAGYGNGSTETKVACEVPPDVYCNEFMLENGDLCDSSQPGAPCSANTGMPAYNYDARCDAETKTALVSAGGAPVYNSESRTYSACGSSQSYEGQEVGCVIPCMVQGPSCSNSCQKRASGLHTAYIPLGQKFNNGYGELSCSQDSAYWDANSSRCEFPCFNYCNVNNAEAHCTATGSSNAGALSMSCGETYSSAYLNAQVKCTCAPQGSYSCTLPCNSYPDETKCNPECGPDGNRTITNSFTIQTWTNTTPVVPVKYGFRRTIAGYPFKYFKDKVPGGKFVYLDAIDMRSEPLDAAKFLKYNVVLGSGFCADNKGVYLLKAETEDGLVYTARADPLSLGSDSYYGAACSKGRDVKLCSALFVDHRSVEDVCINSVEELRGKSWVALGDTGTTSGDGPEITENSFAVTSDGHVLIGAGKETDEYCPFAKFDVYDSSGSKIGENKEVTIRQVDEGACSSGCAALMGTATAACLLCGAMTFGIVTPTSVGWGAGLAVAAGGAAAGFGMTYINNANTYSVFRTVMWGSFAFAAAGVIFGAHGAVFKVQALDFGAGHSAAVPAAVDAAPAAAAPAAPAVPAAAAPAPAAPAAPIVESTGPVVETGTAVSAPYHQSAVNFDGCRKAASPTIWSDLSGIQDAYSGSSTRGTQRAWEMPKNKVSFVIQTVIACAACAAATAAAYACTQSCFGGTDECSGYEWTQISDISVHAHTDAKKISYKSD